MRIADRVADLFVCTTCSEHSERRSENDIVASGDTCSDSHHIAFSDTAVDMTFGEFFLESNGLGRLCEVGVKNKHIRIFFSELYEYFTVGISLSFHIISH